MAVPNAVASLGRSFIRDVIVATLVLVGLYGLAQGVQFQPVQIPGYLLIVGFDLLEGTFGSAGANYDVLFAVYLLGLGILGATVAHVLRRWVPAPSTSWWRLGVAGALVVMGIVSIVFAIGVLLRTSQLTPVLITTATGLIMFALAAWIAGVSESEDDQK